MLTLGRAQLGLSPPPPPARVTVKPRAPSSASLTSASDPEQGHQFPQGSQHVPGAAAPQHCTGIGKEPGDPGCREGRGGGALRVPASLAGQPPPTPFTHRESLKLLRTPGLSPGVGCWKQELFTLQTRPCSQDIGPADGNGLFGKWPAGWRGARSRPHFWDEPVKG